MFSFKSKSCVDKTFFESLVVIYKNLDAKIYYLIYKHDRAS